MGLILVGAVAGDAVSDERLKKSFRKKITAGSRRR